MTTNAAAQHDAWVAAGSRIPVTVGGRTRQLFVRRSGHGPVVTLLHGFPSSSWDWQAVEHLLAVDHTVIALDLLGYGQSDKPWPHAYSTAEHADVISGIWASLGVASTALVGHDVGSSVAQELLARTAEQRLTTGLRSVVFLNGALFTDHYRPARVTRMLATPLLGRLVAGAMNEVRLATSMRALFSDAGRPGEDRFVQMWQALTRDRGQRVIPGLTHYLADKRREQQRWHHATVRTTVPVGIVWGAADPALPVILYTDAVAALPTAMTRLLPEVGHFPQLERPDAVVELIGALEAAERPTKS